MTPHSPLRSSPLSDNGDPFHWPQNDLCDNSHAIVIVETTSTQFAQAVAVAPPSPMVQKREVMAKKVAFGFLFSEVVPCLILFLVIAADKTHGWSGDSFDRYKEYRYCLSVNVTTFVYATF
ncbi:hypothetical protein AAZX31_19G072300 [Glycine max]